MNRALQKKWRRALAVLACAAAACAAAAGPRSHDLGEGLHYLMLRTIPEDLPAARERPDEAQALVIDLRGANTDQSQSRTLVAWLRFSAKPDRPALMLLNGDTSPLLRELLAKARLPATLVLAPSGTVDEADILVDTSAEADREAGEALLQGRPPAELITVQKAKLRWDEEVLTKEKASGGSTVAPEPTPLEKAPDAAEVAAYKPRDQVLARAVQIHRSLVAMKALPRRDSH